MCTSSRRGRSASIVWRITRMGASLVRPTPTPRVNLPEHRSTVSFDTEARSSSDHAEIGATAIPAIALGESVLVLAPTGSGKTLAAFLAAIDRLMFSPAPKKAATRILYVSPLKALAVDIERNLREPLVGIVRQAQRLGVPYRELTIAIRTGDTPSRERARYQREPADI